MMAMIQISRSFQCGRPTCFQRSISLLCRRREAPQAYNRVFPSYLNNNFSSSSLISQLGSASITKRVVCQVTNLANLLIKRCYARKGKLPFEVDIKVTKDTLLYTHNNARFFKMLSFFGLAQLVFWGQLSLFSLSSLDTIDAEAAKGNIDTSNFWGKILMIQTEYKSRMAFLCATIGTLVMFFTYIYPRRTIRQLTLLKGGEILRVMTYSHFGRSRSFTAPLQNLSVQASRASNASQVSLKLKGHRLFYLMDKRDGKFHDTNLFDYAVGLKRNIK